MSAGRLHALLDESATRHPDRVALVEAGGAQVTYAQLADLSRKTGGRLREFGVRRGDRVGIYLEKSIDAIAAIFGVLRVGGVYVPVDPRGPIPRNALILDDCAVDVLIADSRLVSPTLEAWPGSAPEPVVLAVDGCGGGTGLASALAERGDTGETPDCDAVDFEPDDLAYILYTSGSTGRPKGVMLTHRNATSYVDWCSDVFVPSHEDRFSSHAPLHFDLSILDVYLPVKHGACVVLIGHEAGKEPAGLWKLIVETRLTVWYSVPSILSLLVEYGKLDSGPRSALRLVLFAGEVFPVQHLRALVQLLPEPRYLNLYGPTETNVCTYFEIPPEIPETRTEPFPIGRTCSHVQSRVIDEHGDDVSPGQEGELCVSGAGVMRGYWNRPEQTEQAFLVDPEGVRWYRTGDLVVEDESGDFVFHGRRDRMVKRRGYRVELGEIEDCLYAHVDVRQAAVVAVTDENGVQVKAFVATKSGDRLSLIAIKQFCSERIPIYMIPDTFTFLDSLPLTSTNKVDYRSLTDRT